MNPDSALPALSLLGLGFVLGLRHSLDADHLAAVAAIVSRKRTAAAASAVGLWWGIGHTTALVVAGGVLLLLDLEVPPAAATLIELGVSVVLIAMGLSLLVRLMRGASVHQHPHAHGSLVHAHPHVHPPDDREKHGSSAHAHFLLRHLRVTGSSASLLLGILHGLAGSGGLMLLVTATISDVMLGLVYIFLFGFGSVMGMLVMSMVLGIPFLHRGERIQTGFQVAAGVVSILTGIWLGAGIITETALFTV